MTRHHSSAASAPTAALATEIERELREDGVPLMIPGPMASQIIGQSQRTLARLIARGDLATSRTSRAGAARIMIRRGELARYLAAREHRATPARA